MRIVIDRSLCDGNGLCAIEAPALLALDGDEAPYLLREALDAADARAAEKAVSACPKAALRLVEV